MSKSWKEKFNEWIMPFKSKKKVFSTDGKVIFCNACCKQVTCDRKFQLRQHANTGSHKTALDLKFPRQPLMPEAAQGSLSKDAFYEYLCFTMVSLTDAVPYMKKAMTNLRIFYSNLTHVTCVAHGLHRVAEKVREKFPEVNNGKKMFLKAPSRVVYKDEMDDLSPVPVITHWGTWLNTALFYAQNLVKYTAVVEHIAESEQDTESVKKEKFQLFWKKERFPMT